MRTQALRGVACGGGRGRSGGCRGASDCWPTGWSTSAATTATGTPSTFPAGSRASKRPNPRWLHPNYALRLQNRTELDPGL